MKSILPTAHADPTGFRLAADIGGTFTDVVLEGNGRRFSEKVLTTPRAPEQAVLEGTQRLLQGAELGAARIALVLHGTTLATNALIERKGARTAFLTTAGFRDILATGYEKRFDHYDLMIDHPAPVVPRERRIGIPERVTAKGRVLTPLDQGAVRAAARRLLEDGVEAVAVGFLHSYLFDTHERLTADIVQEIMGDSATVCISSEVCPELREYERFTTTATNAYVRPMMSGYLARLQTGLVALGIGAPLYLMTSAGGLCTAESARRLPIRLVESGPAGGAILAAHLARECGLDEVLSFDMGGTTAKICLIVNGEPERARVFEVARTHRHLKGSGWPVRIPVIEMVEIGAGGGSIARVDALGRIGVGPDSAGSEPGPVCYGRGGTLPTVTDANLRLGRIDPDRFAGGRLRLDAAGADAALTRDIGAPLGLEGPWPAAGVSEIVEENMANAARVHAIERGRSIGRATMIAFGGGAPLHAGRLAEKLGIDRILVPTGAGVGSAIGFLRAPVSFEVTRSASVRLAAFDHHTLNALLDAMYTQALETIAPGLDNTAPETRRIADCRYVGQGHEVRVSLPPGPLDKHSAVILRDAFETRYRRLYGLSLPDMEVELITVSVTLSTPPPSFEPISPPPKRPAPTPQGHRAIYEPALGVTVEMPVYWRFDCPPGVHISGPAVVAEDETATVIPASFDAHVDGAGHLVLQRRTGTERE